MIFDFHTHTFPERIAAAAVEKLQRASHTKPFSDGTEDGLRASMSKAGIDGSLVLPVATSPRQVVHINDASIAMNNAAPQTGVYSFGCMHPDFEDYAAELARLAAEGVKGIKLHPVYQDVSFDDPRTLRLLEKAAELGLIVLIHAGYDVAFPGVERGTPRMVRNAMRSVGPFKLVLAHMGGWRCWEEAAELLAGSGVYIDTSFSLGSMTPNGDGFYQDEQELRLMDPERFIRIVRAYGADHVLFGSDSPWADQADAVAGIRELPLAESEKRMALYDNAARLLQLAPQAAPVL